MNQGPQDSSARFISLRAWAREGHLGYSTARREVRRAIDPLPARLVAGRWRIDRAAAEGWLQRQDKRATLDLGAIVDEVAAELEAK